MFMVWGQRKPISVFDIGQFIDGYAVNPMLAGFVWIVHSETVRKTYLAFHHGLSDVNWSLSFATFRDNSDSLPFANPNSVGIRRMNP
tara:strand:+ start:496 stop:756 length:261 start_codon:yes stop_codon:yes gene_type:complete